MAARMLDRRQRLNVLATVVFFFLAFIGAYAAVGLSGTKTGTVLALAAVGAPVLLYAGLAAPLVFPFGPYLFLTPFDRIFDVSTFGTLTRVIGILAAFAMLLYMLRTRRFVAPDRSLANWMLFFLWAIATMFWALDVPTALVTLPTVLQLFGLYVLVSMFPIDGRGLRAVIAAVVLGGTCAAAYGIYLFRNGQAWEQSTRLSIVSDNRSIDPNHFAAALILPMCLTLGLILWRREPFVRAFALTAFCIMLFAMALSGSRGATLGFGVFLLYVIIRDRVHRWGLVGLASVLGATVLIGTGGSIVQRWAAAESTGGAGRVAIWRIGLAAFKDHWLIGAGWGNFPVAFNGAYLKVYESVYTHWYRAPHNILLGIGVELGIIGLALLLLSWFGQFRMLSFISQDSPLYPMRTILEGALLALFASGLFLDIMIEKYVWVAFMVVALTRNAANAASRQQAMSLTLPQASRVAVS